MKKKIIVALLCGIPVFSNAGCTSSESAEPTIYPLSFTSSLEDSVTVMPKTCYSTPAEENGLGGNVYSVTGTVDSVLSEEESLTGTEMFSVQNEDGTAWFGVLDPEYYSNFSGGDLETFESLMDSTMDYTLPEQGEYVTVYGIYTGYSEVLDAPSLYFGIDEFTYETVNNSGDDTAEDSTPTGTPSPTVTPSVTLTPTPTATTPEPTATVEPTPTTSGTTFNNPPTISKTEFDALTNGMSYEEAVNIIGGSGEVLSETGSPGDAYYTVMYTWEGEGDLGANANVMFQDNKLITKAQYGLN